MSAAVFGKTVGLFSFFGFTVESLRFSVGPEMTGGAACFATISMPTKTAPAHTKDVVAPTTCYLDQLYHPALKVAGV
jgi:hypothetical protein